MRSAIANLTRVSIWIVTAISSIAYASDVILSENGKEVAYIESAVLDDSVTYLAPASIFVGKRLIQDDTGACFTEVSTLEGGAALPKVLVSREPAGCPE